MTIGLTAVFCKHWSLSSSVDGKPIRILLHMSSFDVINAWTNRSVGLTDMVSDLSDVSQSKIARLANIKQSPANSS